MIDFLFISNGYGEDAIAADIANLLLAPTRSVAAFPLVGEGKSYARQGIPVLAAFPPLAGGGVSFWKDVKNGWLNLTKAQWKTLKTQRSNVACAVAMGDIYPVLAEHYGLKSKFAFVGTAKSVTVQAYNFFERQLLKKASLIFVRDEKTSQILRRHNVPAQYVGNPMMDGVSASTAAALPPFAGLTIAVLPGSREEAPQNFFIQVEALCALQRRLQKPIRGLVAVPPTIPEAALIAKLEGWDGLSSAGMYRMGDVTLHFLSDQLGDILRASTLALGQAGTANEQAAGLGKPVVAFGPSRWGRLSWYRWRQKKLLGDALAVAWSNAETIADKTAEILENPSLYERMSQEGKTRLGSPGACAQIARALQKSLL